MVHHGEVVLLVQVAALALLVQGVVQALPDLEVVLELLQQELLQQQQQPVL